MKLPRWLDILIPRFVTDDFAAEKWSCDDCMQNHAEPVMLMSDVQPGQRFDGIITVKSFNFFSLGLFPQFGEMRPWKNPHDQVRP